MTASTSSGSTNDSATLFTCNEKQAEWLSVYGARMTAEEGVWQRTDSCLRGEQATGTHRAADDAALNAEDEEGAAAGDDHCTPSVRADVRNLVFHQEKLR